MKEKRVGATLLPGQRGTLRLVRKYGDRLLCVRYRYDEKNRRRVTTVELLEEEMPWDPPEDDVSTWVRVAWGEVELARRIRSHGGRWDGQKKLWVLPRKTVLKLGLQNRIILDKKS